MRSARRTASQGGRGPRRCGAESESAARASRGRLLASAGWEAAQIGVGGAGGRVWSREAAVILGSGVAGAGGSSRSLQRTHVSGVAFRGAGPGLCVQKLQAGPQWWAQGCPRHGWRLRAGKEPCMSSHGQPHVPPETRVPSAGRSLRFSCKPREPTNPLSSLVSAGRDSG